MPDEPDVPVEELVEAEPDPFTANQLRWLAEAADGKRDKVCEVVLDEDGKPQLVERRDMNNRIPLTPSIFTPWGPGGMRGGVTITLTYGEKSVTLPSDTDAVFLTQVSVEKFVFPYYTRMENPAWLGRKKEELFKDDVVAALHREPSITKPHAATTFPVTKDADGNLTLVTVNVL